MSTAAHLREVRTQINQALERAGRPNGPVQIVAVSKTVPHDRILPLYQEGHRIFGENKVKEWQKKHLELPVDCQWHFIGRLQTNKVKYLDSSIELIHSLDRIPLLEKLQEEGEKRRILWKTLVQVNVARDPAKAGLMPEEVKDFIHAAKEASFVQLQGLMTIGREDATPEENRGAFRELRELREQLIRQGLVTAEQFPHLSMGMSHDYLLAVEEGATLVRIGSLLFGQRDDGNT